MRALDLFAGPGGWSVAARRLGIEEWGVELDDDAVATRNAAGHATLYRDVRQATEIGLRRDRGEWDGLIASPPCQTFSMAGKGKGREALDHVLAGVESYRTGTPMTYAELTALSGDERTALVLEPLRYVHGLRPTWLAFEQVPTVLSVWEAYAEILQTWGYAVWTGNMHAEQYGVPQTRKRAILIASLAREVGQPTPTHSRHYSRSPEKLDPGVEKWVSMAEALGWSEVDGYALRNNSSAKAAERALDEPAPTIYYGQRSNYVAWEWHGEGEPKPLPDWAYTRPSTTIVGSFRPEVVAAPGYRTTVSRQNAPDSVRVTVEEAGILQSFPADYPWQGSKTKRYQQVGNAIPPKLAEVVLAEAAGVARAEVAA